MKLTPDIEPIRANIFNKKTLPDVNAVFRELIHEETTINTLESMDFPTRRDYVYIKTHKLYAQSSFTKSEPQLFECKAYGYIASHYKRRNICNYYKKPNHIILVWNQRPNMHQSKHKAYQAYKAYVSQVEITPYSLDPKALQKITQDSVATALPGLFQCSHYCLYW